ncbi:hypothetical protein SDC9_150528 [bioreactor metagenome]|uniref:Uncharacterized protein n=1 Tax=bioreactor metagenome TaxID=1076179 RepID=A0A645EMR9_9ZZZZ
MQYVQKLSHPYMMVTLVEKLLSRKTGNPSAISPSPSETAKTRLPAKTSSRRTGNLCSSLVPNTISTKGNRLYSFLATSSCCIMQPQTATQRPGCSSFCFLRAPTFPNTRFSACSRTQQVLKRIRSASSFAVAF